MPFWMMFFISLAFTVVGELLRPKPKIDDPKASSLGDFRFPTAEETRVIPVIYGKVKVSAPNVVWWGDLRAVPIKKKVKTGLFSSDTILQGYKYYLGMQAALCWGGSELTFSQILFDDKVVSLSFLSNTADVVTFTMNSPALFSNEQPNNGVSGNVKLYRGTFNQSQNAYLAAQFGEATIPAYRGICYAAFEACYFGNNDTVPPASFILSRLPNPLGLTLNRHFIGDDANPACAVYEILTNTFWGAAIPAGMIDADSFVAVANTLHAESLGISLQIDSPSTAEQLIVEILRHVDGVLYVEPTSGKWTIALARADYVVDTLPLLDESNIEASTLSYTRGSWDETKNTVKIKYLEASQNFTERMVQHQNLANISARGGQVDAESIDFMGLSNATAANVVAARVMKTLSTPLAKLEFELNRTVVSLRPGSVFRFAWAQLGITQQVYRIVDIDRGATDSSVLKITAVEDIFATSAVSYDNPGESGWVDPFSPPTDMPRQDVFELPYGLTNSGDRFLASVGSPSKGIDKGYRIWQDPAGGTTFAETGTAGFTPSGILTSDYAKNSTGSFIIDSAVLLETVIIPTAIEVSSGQSVIRIKSTAGEEFAAWTTLTENGDGTWTVGGILRGLYDTPPLLHTAGAIVWFVSDGMSLLRSDAYTSNATVKSKLTAFNRSGELSLASATTHTTAIEHRANKPYPPANFRFNGVYYLETVSGALTVAWAHRDRVVQGYNALAQTAADQGPESGVTYTVKLYDETNVLRRTETGLAATTYSWATEAEDSGLTMATGDVNTMSLLHLDGANASTFIPDVAGKAWTVAGNAQISTAQSQFGGASLLLDGAGDYITTVSNADFNVAPAGDFTVEFWLYLNNKDNTDGNAIFCVGDATGYFQLLVRSNTFQVNVRNASDGAFHDLIAAQTLTNGVWAHYAFTRAGSTYRLFYQGALLTPSTNTLPSSFTLGGNAAFVGANYTGGVTSAAGYIDELRVSKGIARYTANFTPPAAPFTLVSSEADLVKDACAHYYSLDEMIGTTIKDWESNSALNLTATGVTLAQATVRSGGLRSVAFDSTDRLVSSIRPAELMGGFSYSFVGWVNITAWSAASNTIYSFGQPSVETAAENILGSLYIDASRKLVHLHEYSAGTNQTANAAAMAALSLSTPYLIGITKDPATKTIKFYVNGVLADTVAYTDEATGGTGATCRLILGADSTAGGANSGLNGRLQDTLFTTDLLTDADHAWLYNGGIGRGRLDVLGLDTRLNTSVRAEVFAVRGGVESVHLDHAVTRS